MSVESWIEENYPDFPPWNAPAEAHVIHSLNKWKGARKEMLEKHGVGYSRRVVYDKLNSDVGVPFEFRGDTCSLCYRYATGRRITSCRRCPIVVMRGRACDEDNWVSGETVDSEWHRSKDNPEIMIKLLEDTLAFVRANPRKFSSI